GEHTVEIWHFDRSGTGVLEFGIAAGTKTEFDDSFRLVGDAGHRNFAPLIKTDLQDDIRNESATAYLRIPFDVEDPNNIGNLLLRPRYGDGYAAYLNGTLVASANAPEQLTHTSTAVIDRFDSAALVQDLIDLTEHKALIKQGTNLLAVQALNNAADDIDMFYSTDLIMTLSEAPINLTQSTSIKARAYLDGKWSVLTNPTYTVAFPASAENLRISEINYHPSSATLAEIDAGITDADDFEFIELTNISDEPVDLSNVSFTQIVVDGNDEGVAFDFAEGSITEIAPGQHILVVEDIAAFQARYGTELPVAGQWSGALSNSAETISLVAGEQLIHRFKYSDAWYPRTDGGGATLEVFSPATQALGDWAAASGWRPSVIGGTPGAAASVNPGDVNADGIFDSADLLIVFQAGEYEDGVTGNSTFEEGDWNGDGDFNTSDIVFAFMQGNYIGDQPQVPAAAVAVRNDFTDTNDDDDDKRLKKDPKIALHDSLFESWV
ncbi:MAG: lamin tail domain-containing protein, partial [Planctomycetales bacterium]|nr:lamin tail domain-containing protein [Planctomycetales bacterium]